MTRRPSPGLPSHADLLAARPQLTARSHDRASSKTPIASTTGHLSHEPPTVVQYPPAVTSQDSGRQAGGTVSEINARRTSASLLISSPQPQTTD